MNWRRGRAYGQDLRDKMFAAIDRGIEPVEVAETFTVSVSWIYKALGRRRATGETTARPQRCHVAGKLDLHHDAICARVTAVPDMTIAELRDWLRAARGISVSHAVMWETLKRLGLSLKKKTQHAAEQERPDVAAARQDWRVMQPRLNPEKLVFIDETWASTNMCRRYGSALHGQRLIAFVPHGHWNVTTFLGALRHDGMTASLVIDGALNGELFRAYVEQMLAPTLSPGEIVTMDNLSSHRVRGIRGASVLYLPSYLPDLNPIEMAFAKLKQLWRAAAARTREALWNVIGQSLHAITATECANYLAHCGYLQSGR